MFKYEKKIIEFFQKHYLAVGAILISLFALLIRYCMLDFESGDYVIFLSPWYDYLKSNGGFKALANYPGDYNVPYMTIMALLTYLPIPKLYAIKLVSIIFDFAIAVSSAFLVKQIVKKNKKEIALITYSIVLFLPTVLMNSALWGQCDSIYATFIILSLLFLLKEKYIPSFIMLGLAFSFKLQFIFILPLYVIIYVCQKKYSILNFLIIPLIDIILSIPAMIAGKPFKDCLMVYLNQTGTYKDSLTLNFFNIYNILNGTPEIFYKVGELLVLVVCLITLIYCLYKNVKWNNEKIITLGLWFLVVITFLLPGMHERYLFVGEVLALIYYVAYKKNLPIVIFIIFSPIITYSSFLFGLSFPYSQIMSILYLVLIIYFTKDTIKLLDNMEEK